MKHDCVETSTSFDRKAAGHPPGGRTSGNRSGVGLRGVAASCDAIGMANTASNQELARRIEQLIHEHIAASRKVAQEAVERAFSAAKMAEPAQTRTSRRLVSKGRKHRRDSKEIAALSELFYEAVSEKPGETMGVLAMDVGATSQDLRVPIDLLKRSGRVRCVGDLRHMRYFPMVGEASTTG